MQQFTVSEAGYKKYSRNSRRVLYGFASIVAAGLLYLLVLAIEKGKFDMTMIIPPCVVAVALSFQIPRILRRQKKMVMSYTINLSDHEITREQVDTRPLTINFMEIKEITKTRKGHFMIKGLTRTDYIVIPNWIDNYPQLEKQLQTLAPIEEKTKEHRYATVRALLSMISIPLMVGSFLVKDKAVAAIFAVLAVGLLGWIYYETRVSKNMPENVRRRSWTYLIMIAAIIYITWQKFTA
ncbi:MAG TPA: hypothetical protein VGQ51_18335 [Puia sp.]|jgi:hypothetical protein|nr:hypothetical protein [Puia sp.]